MPPGTVYYKGHVRAPNKDHLMQLAARRHKGLQSSLLATDVPPAYDCRTLNIVGPVKNQGQCGSCWDFSGTCVAESAHYMAGSLPADGSMNLSEQYTLSCGQNGGCNGDDNTTVLIWAKKTGIPLSKDYGPYNASGGRCSFQQSMALYKLDDWGFCDPQASQGYQSVTDTQLIKAAMLKYGVIGCAIAADNAFSNAQSGQVFNKTTSQEIDHDVALVGWQDTSTKVSGLVGSAIGSLINTVAAVTAADGWWWMRNSWGADWCEKGYVRIGYGINMVGTEAVWGYVNPKNPPIDFF